MNGRRASLVHRAEYALTAAALALTARLSDVATARLAGAIGRLGYRPLGIRRDVVEANLRLAYPDREDDWIRNTAVAAYAHLARETIATLRCGRIGPAAALEQTDVEGLDAVRTALDAGRGVLILAGHLGNWELGGAAVAAHGLPMDAVTRRLSNPLSDAAILAARNRFGIHCIDRSEATRRGIESLRANRLLTLVADQDARDGGIFVPFFGRPASTPRGPAVLALRTGAPAFFMEPLRMSSGRLRVRLLPIDPAAARPDARADTRTITLAYVQALEAAVRRAPDQYLWHHRRWKTRSPEEPLSGRPV